MRQNRHSVRVRLTAWYAAALAVIILVFSIGIYVFVRSSLLKHLDRELDVDFAAIETLLREEPDELKELVKVIRDSESILGSPEKKVLESEMENHRIARRSLIAASDIKKGTVITRDKVVVKRPALGVHPKDLDVVVGKKARVNIKKDRWITWESLL